MDMKTSMDEIGLLFEQVEDNASSPLGFSRCISLLISDLEKKPGLLEKHTQEYLFLIRSYVRDRLKQKKKRELRDSPYFVPIENSFIGPDLGGKAQEFADKWLTPDEVARIHETFRLDCYAPSISRRMFK